MRRFRGFAPIVIILIVVVILLVGGVAYYVGTKGLFTTPATTPTSASPSPTAQNPTPDPTANWKTYTNSVQSYSFKYAPTWTIDTKAADQDQNSVVKLTKDQATLQISANMFGIGGVGQDYTGTPVTVSGIKLYEYKLNSMDGATIILGVTDTLKQSLGLFQFNGKTYGVSLTYPNSYDQSSKGADIKTEFDLMLATFQFTAGATQTGTVSGSVCYPASVIPAGKIVAKNILTSALTSFANAQNNMAFLITLAPGTYHLRYEPAGYALKGYYTSCTGSEPSCQDNSTKRSSIAVMVAPNQPASGVKLCDYYYSANMEPDF